METSKRIIAVVTLVLALLLFSSPFIGFSSSTAITVNVLGASLSERVDPVTEEPYGDIMQYEWTQLGATAGWTGYSAGPAPDRPEVVWTQNAFGFGPFFAKTVTVFDGKAFSMAGGSVYGWDAFTGEEKFYTYLSNAQAITKLDDTYFFVDHDSGQGGLGISSTVGTLTNTSITVFRTADGAFVSNFTLTGVGFQPGAGGYFPGRYDPETKMKYVRGYNAQTNECSYYAIDLSDPTAPKLGWKAVLDESGEELAAGGGMIFVGTVNGAILAMNGTTGDVIWRAPKIGFAQYTATYVDGILIQTASSTRVTAYNASTGQILWDKDQGGRAFFAFSGVTAYGRFYQHNIAVPEGFIGCWDIKTGELLWKQRALYNIGYIHPAVADGKLYIQSSDGQGAAGAEIIPRAFSCYDAFTGEKLWDIDATISSPSIAYGNLYGIIGWGTITCFSSAEPKDWAMWRGNTANSGVGQSGPADISSPTWAFNTGGILTSSPVVVDGAVYFGSHDGNIYSVDAYEGTLIWKFPTTYKIWSTPAVVGGVVYTGADDGNVYAIDADTGQQIWKTPVGGGVTNFVFAATWQPRSSPIVVGDRLYVGALDGKVYCLDTDGTVRWTYPTGRPIGGSPAYSNGVIFISSTNHFIYALDATDGHLVWEFESNATVARAYTDWFPFSTPVVADERVLWGAGPVYGDKAFFALNETTGEELWRISLLGNTPPCQTPTVVDGVFIIGEFMGVSIRNLTDGALIWRQWLGHEVYSSVAYAEDMRGDKFYVGSDTYSITCFDAAAAMANETGAVLSNYATGSHVQSSPALWDGKLYVTSADFNLYMFSDAPTVSTSIWAVSSKGVEMLPNETVVISGGLKPGIPNAEVLVTFTKPDGTLVDVTTTTSEMGLFEASYTPTVAGNWSWTAWWNGKELPHISYSYAFTEDMPLKVVSPEEPTNGEEPPPEGIPMEYIYAIVAVVAIVIIAVAAYVYMKRGK